MTKLLWFALCFLFVASCRQKPKSTTDGANNNNTDQITKNSVTQADSFQDTISGISFSGIKTKDGFELSYKLKNEDTTRRLQHKFVNLYEIIFPELGVAIYDKTSYHMQRLFVYADSILILPLLGINNYIQMYIINLKSGEIIGSDIVTHFSMVWLSKDHQMRIVRAQTQEPTDSSVKYTLNSFSIVNGHITSEQNRFVTVQESIRYNEKAQYNVIKHIY